MGGGSGGGAPAPATPPVPPSPPPVPVQDYAAFSPGQQGLLAQQMQQGFGGSLLDHQNAMGFYKDMQAPQISRPEQIKQYLEQIKPGSTAPAAPQPSAWRGAGQSERPGMVYVKSDGSGGYWAPIGEQSY